MLISVKHHCKKNLNFGMNKHFFYDLGDFRLNHELFIMNYLNRRQFRIIISQKLISYEVSAVRGLRLDIGLSYNFGESRPHAGRYRAIPLLLTRPCLGLLPFIRRSFLLDF